MKLKASKVRTSVLTAVGWLAAAWVLFYFANASGVWQLSFVALLFAAWGIGRDVSKEGLFHPALIFGYFTLLITLIDLAWLAYYMNDVAPFFWYKLPVSPNSIAILAGEQLVLLSATYAGYLLVRGVAARRIEHASYQRSPVDSFWPILYLGGIFALFALILSSGGFTELFNNMGAKYERAEGRGPLVLLQYLAYAGILMWFKKNLWRPAWQRYGGIIALSFPMLLSGSRVEMLICLAAALYMDERTGTRFDIAKIVVAGLALALFFAVYQAFRGQAEIEVFTAIYKDLSMGTGYVAAAQEGMLGDGLRPKVLLQAVTPLLPGSIEAFLDPPRSPANVLTQTLFPGTKITVSMGVMGEANYVLYSGLSFLYYLVVGTAISWAGSYGWKKSLLLAAVVAGCVVRIVKSGGATGVASMLLLAAPIIAAYAMTYLLSKLYKKDAPEGTPTDVRSS